jgi:hypothetical protein
MINKEQLLRGAIEKYEGEIMTLQVMVMGLKTELNLGRYKENNQSQETKDACISLVSKSPDTNIKQSTKSEILKDYPIKKKQEERQGDGL